MPEFLGPHVAVAGGAGARIGKPTGGDDEFRAGVFLRLDLGLGLELGFPARVVARDTVFLDDGLHRIEAVPPGRLVHGLYLAPGDDFYARKRAGTKEGIYHITRHVRCRESTVSALYDTP